MGVLRLGGCCLLVYGCRIVRFRFRFRVVVGLVWCWFCTMFYLVVDCCVLFAGVYYCDCSFNSVAFWLILVVLM